MLRLPKLSKITNFANTFNFKTPEKENQQDLRQKTTVKDAVNPGERGDFFIQALFDKQAAQQSAGIAKTQKLIEEAYKAKANPKASEFKTGTEKPASDSPKIDKQDKKREQKNLDQQNRKRELVGRMFQKLKQNAQKFIPMAALSAVTLTLAAVIPGQDDNIKDNNFSGDLNDFRKQGAVEEVVDKSSSAGLEQLGKEIPRRSPEHFSQANDLGGEKHIVLRNSMRGVYVKPTLTLELAEQEKPLLERHLDPSLEAVVLILGKEDKVLLPPSLQAVPGTEAEVKNLLTRYDEVLSQAGTLAKGKAYTKSAEALTKTIRLMADTALNPEKFDQNHLEVKKGFQVALGDFRKNQGYLQFNESHFAKIEAIMQDANALHQEVAQKQMQKLQELRAEKDQGEQQASSTK